MSQTISVNMPDDLKKQLDRLTVEEGLSRSDVVRDSIREYIFIKRFRTPRRKMIPHAESRGVFTDQDVFDRVS